MAKIKIISTKIFTFIGIFCTIIATIQGIDYLYNKQYKIENEITLYEYDVQQLIKNDTSSKIKVYYEDNIVNNLYYKSYKIKNTGRKAINPTDYIENICIETSNNVILDAQLISYSSSYIQKNIIDKTIINENKICFPNILLNPDDYFQINVITKEFPKSNKIIGTISGIKKININNSNTIQYKLNIGKKIVTIFAILLFPLIIVLISQILIDTILYKKRTKDFMKKFKCDKQISELFSTYYFETIKSIKRNSKNINKDIKSFNKEIKNYIIDIYNKSDKS